MLNDIRIANIFFRVGSISKLFILLWLMSGSSPPMRHKLYGKMNCSLFQHEKRRKVINFLSNYLAVNKKFLYPCQNTNKSIIIIVSNLNFRNKDMGTV